MANGDLYTVGSELQNILARRKAEAQQALLNEFKQKEFEQSQKESEAQIEATKENTLSNRIWREGQAKIDAANAKRVQLADLDEVGFSPESVIPSGQLGPDQLTLGKETGRIATDTTPISSNIGDGFGEKNIWKGNAEQREKFTRKKQRTGLIQELMKDPKADKDLINRLMIADAYGGDDMSAAELKAVTGSDTGSEPTSVKEYKFAVSQGYKGSFDQYQKEDANRRTPRPPAQHNLQLREVKDSRTGENVLVWFDPRNPTAPPIPVGGGYGPKPAGGLGIANRVFNEASLREYSDTFQEYANLTRTRPGSPAALNAETKVRSLGRTLALNANLPQDVKEWVVGIMEDDDRRPTSEIMDELKAQVDPNNPQDQHKLGLFWQALKTIRQE